jgi:hypothetical protein
VRAGCDRRRVEVLPLDPSVLDSVQFFDRVEGVWSFGDGTSAAGRSAEHRYAVDGDYAVSHTAVDGARSTVVVRVRTHDVAISKLAAPPAARAGETRVISVFVSDAHYPETVQVRLFKRAADGWTPVGALTRPVEARTEFAFSYTFTRDDALAGEVQFRAVATIEGARDAYPSDNEATAAPTKVKASSLASN